MIWDGDQRGIEGDNAGTSATLENVTIDGMVQNGIWADDSSFTVNNTIATRSGTDFSPGPTGTLTGSNNTSSDGSATPGGNVFL